MGRGRLVLAVAAVAVVAAVAIPLWGGPPGERESVLLVGDSLNVGIEPYLADVLTGWTIRSDDVVGRSTPDGIAALEQQRAAPGPLVVSLGTNDPPADVGAFRAAVGRVLALAGPGRCVVWATIRRDGGADEGYNAVLREAAAAAPNLRLVDWAAMVQAHPDWLAADGVHGTPDGYRARADEVARIVRACS